MLLCMKRTTLNLDERVMARLREEAARRGTTMSALMEAALRLFFRTEEAAPGEDRLPDLPTFQSGGARVDIADREALYELMEGR
jgi:plasmid stability protein